MTNTLADLNRHLFTQLDRLTEDCMTPEQIDTEAKRAEAIVAVSEQIVRGAHLQLKAAKILADHGDRFKGQLGVITGAPVRIQLRRSKGWRMPENTVKVDRTTKWGNPFNFKDSSHCWTALAYGCKGDPAGRHEASVKAFREWIESGKFMLLTGVGIYMTDGKKKVPFGISPDVSAPMPPSLEQIQRELRGKNLACWCKPGDPCHADVLLELANRP